MSKSLNIKSSKEIALLSPILDPEWVWKREEVPLNRLAFDKPLLENVKAFDGWFLSRLMSSLCCRIASKERKLTEKIKMINKKPIQERDEDPSI